MMTPLEAARSLVAMASIHPTQAGPWRCLYCQVDILRIEGKQEHKPDCPWLSMPAIVAVMEAAQAFVDGVGEGKHYCPGCIRVTDEHSDTCTYWPLYRSLLQVQPS